MPVDMFATKLKLFIFLAFIFAVFQIQACGGSGGGQNSEHSEAKDKSAYYPLKSPYTGNEVIYFYGKDQSTPLSLVFEGFDEIPLYLFGGEKGLWKNHGGLKRECNELMPTHTHCYFTDPRDMNEQYDQDRVCKFLARPTMVVACDANSCIGEDYYDDCSSGPRSETDKPAFQPSMVNSNKVILSIYESSEINNHPLSANVYYTLSLDVAEEISRSGRLPMINLSKIVADFTGRLYPDAEIRLQKAARMYPEIFYNPQARFLIIDEPFWTGSGHTDETKTKEHVQLIQKTSNLIREINSKASIGINLAPNYKNFDELKIDVNPVSDYIDWIGMDVYVFFGNTSNKQEGQVKIFYDFMKSVYPDKGNMIVLQMFSPVDWVSPAQWSGNESRDFMSLMNPLLEYGYLFDRIMIWGGASVSELPHNYAGNQLPQEVADFYKKKIIDIGN